MSIQTAERWALVAFIAFVILFGVFGCSVLKTPAGESWNFLYDSSVEIEIVLPDGTKATFRRNVSPDNEAIRAMAKGLAEGAVKGAVGGRD